MPSIVSVKFNDEEAEPLRRAQAASGVPGLSAHIKQVYFVALKLNVGALHEIRCDFDRVGDGVERLRNSGAGKPVLAAVGGCRRCGGRRPSAVDPPTWWIARPSAGEKASSEGPAAPGAAQGRVGAIYAARACSAASPMPMATQRKPNAAGVREAG